jgi:uncharacterized protein YkwD
MSGELHISAPRRLMSSDARTRVLAPVVLAVALVGGIFALSSPGSASTADEATLASLVNGARSAAGLAPLTVSGALSDVARAHSASMAAKGTLSHSGDLAGAVGTAVGDWTSLAENVAVADSVAEAHSELMASGEHRAHILGDFTVLGVGVVDSGGRVWVTELFAKTGTVAAAPAPEPAPEPVVAPVVDATVTTAAAAPAPTPTPASGPAPKKAARRTVGAGPTRPAGPPSAAAAGAEESCVPERSEGRGHAYGRCDLVPRGR